MQHVTLDPLAAVEKPPKLPERPVAVNAERSLERMARAHLIGDGANAANPRCDVGRLGCGSAAKHGFEEPRRLEDAELHVDDALAFELNHERALAFDPA